MKHLKLICFCLIIVIYFNGCKNKDNTDPFAAVGFNPYDATLNKRIEAYQDAALPNFANSKTGNSALYIDFSSGISNAFKQGNNGNLINECFGSILSEKFEVYKLGQKQILPLSVANSTELGQRISDVNEYSDIYAPIQQAVEKIVESNNDALLITDFEEWQNSSEITTAPFLKIPFTKWLSKGNTIHFFVAPYTEGKVNKHLFFTIFNCGNPNESSMLTKLESKLSTLTRFDLSNRNYKLETKYPNEKAGGIFYDANAKTDKSKNILDLKESYTNGLKKGNHFEFYPFGLDWNTINETHNAYKNQNQFNDFFRNLFIDLSNEDAYTYGDFDVKVYDVTEDFIFFAKCNEAKSHKPKIDKGSNGEDKFSDNEKDNIAISCYDNKGKIKEEWVYKNKPSTIIPEVFILNRELFKNTKANDKKKVELGVAFDTKFNLKNISNPDGLMRIDIVLNSAEPNLSNPILDKFKWTNSKSISNVALFESIKTTLQEVGVKPSNKIIYSYYIKTIQ